MTKANREMENDNRNYHETQPWRIVDMMIEMASFMSNSNSFSDVFVTIHFSIDSQSIALCDHRIIVWCCFELFICFAFFFIAILSPTSSNSGCVCNFFARCYLAIEITFEAFPRWASSISFITVAIRIVSDFSRNLLSWGFFFPAIDDQSGL